MTIRARQRWTGLWNISFGFFGIQIGFALQNANASRIFQALGTPLDKLGLMWVAAPLTGLIVQPLVGHYSDRTWTRIGRRRPFFLGGAIVAAAALAVMANPGTLAVAAITLWLLDASLNVCMEPFRAFVGDMLAPDQQPAGYAWQTAFIGAGAVLASLAPWVLEHQFHLANTAAAGTVTPTVRIGFYLGAAALLGAVLWTVATTREYPPEASDQTCGLVDVRRDGALVAPATGWLWIMRGLILGAVILLLQWFGWLAGAGEALLVSISLVVFGAAQIAARRRHLRGGRPTVISHLVSDLATMPAPVRRLARVQFLTWGALILMWIYATPAVASAAWATLDPTSAAYGEAANWVGVLFAIYSAVAVAAAFALPPVARRWGAVRTHAACLAIGALGFAGLFAGRLPALLPLPMIAIGIAWASILTMPYILLARWLPRGKLGVYMGLFNLFVVLPQLIIATVMGGVMKAWFPSSPQTVLLIGAALLALAAATMAAGPTAEPAPDQD